MRYRELDPVLVAFWTLIAVSIPTIAELVHHYPSLDERIRDARPLAPLPLPSDLLDLAGVSHPDSGDLALRQTYKPEPQPRSGIAAAYAVLRADTLESHLLVLRHDIACGKCRDLLVPARYNPQLSLLQRVALIEPFETEHGPIDSEDFLAQLRDWSLDEAVGLGDDIDGISGATNSTTGLVEQLNAAASWLRADGRGLLDRACSGGK